MANADDAALKRFVTQRFVNDLASGDAYEESGPALSVFAAVAEDELRGLLQRSIADVGTLVESRAWLAIGAQIGYFDGIPPLDDIQRNIVAVAAEYAEQAVWPAWFRRFAVELGRGSAQIETPVDLPRENAAALAIFQSALILARQFREPLIAGLQRALQNSVSALDDAVPDVSGEDVFETIEASVNLRWKDLTSRQSLARSVAGFLQLIDLLAAFDALFPETEGSERVRVVNGRLMVRRELDTADQTREALSKLTANVLAWRFNLWQEATVRRLEVVTDAFWYLCQREFNRYPELSIRWSAARSRTELARLLDRWRERCDPEPDKAAPDLSFVLRGVTQTPAIETE